MDDLIRGLLRSEAYDHPVSRFDVLETHISWVILTGDFAYKLKKPVNFMAGIKGKSFSVPELAAAGVRRVSLATSLYRAAMSGLVDAAREVQGQGSFGYLEHSLTTPELNAYMEQ